MRFYQVFKIVKDNQLEPMGSFEARTAQGAIQEMVRRGNCSGTDWTASYHAIPFGPHFRKLKIKATK